jgi:hypothetical protein
MSASNSSYASNLIAAAQIYSTYSTSITFGLGLIGNLLNILVFTNLKIFRLNRCAFYLIVASFVDIVQNCQTFTFNIWSVSVNGIEPSTVSLIGCKLRTMLPQWCRLMLASIVCFASIDQFLCTNPVVYLRQLSTLTLARYEICFSTILCLLHTVPYGIFLQIQPPLGCKIANTNLINYSSYFFYPIFNGLFPILMSSFFSILAYRNVRRIIRRQIPIDRRRLDQQLTAMIFIRVIFFVLLQLPFAIYRIYSLNWLIARADTLAYAIQQWAAAISFSLINLSHAVSLSISHTITIILNHCR